MSRGRPIHGFDGATALNFKVIPYATEAALLAAAPVKNTIGVITDTKITSWIFAPSEPTVPLEGQLWIAAGTSSPVEFNALKKNGIAVYPVAAYQYISGAWVQKTAKSYIDGAWQDWFTYLFNNGAVNDALTGGINGTIQDGAIYFYGSVDVSYNKTYTTVNKVDLTGINAVKAVIVSPNSFEDAYFRLLADDAQHNGERVTLAYLVAAHSTYSPFVGEVREITLDVSALSGEYYLGYAWGVDSGSANAKTITGYIQRWWLE